MSAPSMATPFHDLARKRDLWWQFTIRTVELRHRGSYLGIVWAVLTPLLMLGLYYVVFGQIFGGSFGVLPDETRTDYALAFFLGLILHQVTSETLSLAPGIILANPNLVKKVVFPLDLLPLAQLGASWFNLLISITLMVLGAVALGRGVTIAGLVWLPVILLPLLLLTAGLGWLFAALGVFFRDLGQIMPFVGQVVLYASAVVYPIAKIPSRDLGVSQMEPPAALDRIGPRCVGVGYRAQPEPPRLHLRRRDHRVSFRPLDFSKTSNDLRGRDLISGSTFD